MSVGGLLLVALGIAIGMVGIVVPMVPGTGLVVLSIGAWALVESTTRSGWCWELWWGWPLQPPW